jgi:hypothetical protein
MQLQRPFYIFSIPGLAVRPDKLGEDRRRLLTLQRTWFSRALVCLSAIALFLALYWLYQLAPMAADMTPFAAKSRSVGWLICAGSFLLANLFVQVPATVIPLLLASPEQVAKTPPYEAAAILPQFMVWGLRLSAILPDLADPSAAPSAPSTSNNKTNPLTATAAASHEGLDSAVTPNTPDLADTDLQVSASGSANADAIVSELAVAATSATEASADLTASETETSEAIAHLPEVANADANIPDPSPEPLSGSISASATADDGKEPLPAEPLPTTTEALFPAEVQEPAASDSDSQAGAAPRAASVAAPAPTSLHGGTEKAVADIVQSLNEIDVEFEDNAPSASSTTLEESHGAAAAIPPVAATSSTVQEAKSGQIT